jgi:1-acyl-sn-glycerol-3-phosphate acyltransferase
MFYLRLLLAVLGFVAASLYGVAIALARRDRSRVAYDYGRMVARWVAPPLGIRARVVGGERLTEVRPCVLIANHQSVLDVPVLASAFKPGAVIIAKKEVINVPLFGWIYEVTGNIRIDRGDTRSAVGRLKEVEDAIRARKVAVWIFPEGTRGKEAGRMLPFKKGGFQVALLTGAPLVPVVTAPLKPRSDVKARRLLPNEVEVRVLEPIPTAGLGEADLPALMHEARRRMSAALVDQCIERGIVPPPETVWDALQPFQRGSFLASGGGPSSRGGGEPRSSSTGGAPASGSTAVGGV